MVDRLSSCVMCIVLDNIYDTKLFVSQSVVLLYFFNTCINGGLCNCEVQFKIVEDPQETFLIWIVYTCMVSLLKMQAELINSSIRTQ